MSALYGPTLAVIELCRIACGRNLGNLSLSGWMSDKKTSLLSCTDDTICEIWFSFLDRLWNWERLQNLCLIVIIWGWDRRFRSILCSLPDSSYWVTLSIVWLGIYSRSIDWWWSLNRLGLDNKMSWFRWGLLVSLLSWTQTFPLLTMMRFYRLMSNYRCLSCFHGRLIFNKSIVVCHH